MVKKSQNDPVEFKECEPQDNNAVSKFFKTIYKELGWEIVAWERLDDPKAFFDEHKGVLIIAKAKDHVIGTAGFVSLSDGNTVLKRFFIHPSYRGTSVAPKLLQHALEAAKQLGFKEIFLDVRKDNTRAVHFWGGNHFTLFSPEVYDEWEETSYKPHLRLYFKKKL